eukprot:scaffold19457_cov49-Attheya_sp.AAC.3
MTDVFAHKQVAELGSLDEGHDLDGTPSFLSGALPDRVGHRPHVESCLPQAQMDQQSPGDVMEGLVVAARTLTKGLVTEGPLSMPPNYISFHLNSREIPNGACMTPGGPLYGTEFAHIRSLWRPPEDAIMLEEVSKKGKRWHSIQGGGQGSMCLCLTLRDADHVIHSGWGERRLLEGEEISGRALPHGLVLVYAPRSLDEVPVVIRILEASLKYATSTER